GGEDGSLKRLAARRAPVPRAALCRTGRGLATLARQRGPGKRGSTDDCPRSLVVPVLRHVRTVGAPSATDGSEAGAFRQGGFAQGKQPLAGMRKAPEMCVRGPALPLLDTLPPPVRMALELHQRPADRGAAPMKCNKCTK